MADKIRTSSGGGHGGLYFIVGILVIVVGVLAFFLFGGDFGDGDRDIDVNITAPAPSGSGGEGGGTSQ